MPVELKRVYDAPHPRDGHRVLVDRLWPRGVTKDQADVDEWLKDIAPSTTLRQWFDHDPVRWGEFRRRYLSELKDHRDRLLPLVSRAKRGTVTLVFGARDPAHNHAVVVKQYLRMLGVE